MRTQTIIWILISLVSVGFVINGECKPVVLISQMNMSGIALWMYRRQPEIEKSGYQRLCLWMVVGCLGMMCGVIALLLVSHLIHGGSLSQMPFSGQVDFND